MQKKQTKIKNEPFEGLVLDQYEQEIEDSVPENFVIPKISKEDLEMFIQAAVRHKNFAKSKRINIRVNNEDLTRIKHRAKQNNMPYQTLLSTMIHKFANGELKASL